MDALTPPTDFDALRRAIEEAGQDAMNPDAENRQALFERAILNVLDLRNNAMAIYSRQVRNPEARRKAHKTRRHAERKIGELLIAAARAGLRYIHQKTGKIGPASSLITLEKLGITRKQSQTWQKLARMSDAAFDAGLDAELTRKSQHRHRRANTDAPPGRAGALVPIRPRIQLPGKVTRTGWRLPKDMSLEDWLACGQMLDRVEGSVQWWRGDWWAFGSGRQWGEGPELAEKAGVNYSTVRTYGSVARAFELSNRLDNLTFTHHFAVMAAETTEERLAWLRRAETEGWSVAELRREIRQVQKVARQAELDREKDGPQSEPTRSDHGPSPSPQTSPALEPAPEPVKEPAPADDDALAQELAPVPKRDNAPQTAPDQPTPTPEEATRYRRFVVTLSSSVHGELDRHQAPTRAAALDLARTMVDDAIAREQERQWLHGETVVIKIEQDDE